MTQDFNNAFAENAQRQRDLRLQLAELGSADRSDTEMQFIEWSPGRKMQRLWSMEDGTHIDIPRYMVAAAITKRLANGQFRFTANQADAPPIKEGDIRCFLADDSPERTSGLLDQAGLGHLPACPMKALRSEFSKEQHGEHRHVASWKALLSFKERQEREKDREERRQETAAMLAMAGQASERGPRARSS